MPKCLTLNGTKYYEDSKCPSCSGEKDTGGRLKLNKRKYYFLKCEKCKYTIKSEKARYKEYKYLKKLSDKAVGL